MNILRKINRISFLVSFVVTLKCFFVLVARKILVRFVLFRPIPIDVSNAFVLVEI